MNMDIKEYNNLKRYFRNGKECIFDKTKHLLRIATPEEEIRQRVVEFLFDKMKIPYQAMETEIPVSYFVPGGRGRMDIVVYGICNEQRRPIMVVECKAASICLTEEVYLQAKGYSEIIDIPILMVTNGADAGILAWNYEKEEYEAILEFPTYEELCSPETIQTIPLTEEPYERQHYLDLFKNEVIDQEILYGTFVGEDCKRDYVPYIVNLAEGLLDTSHCIQEMDLLEYKFQKDGGLRYTTFGNTSGGSYPGLYRYFLIEDKKGDTQIISITVAGCVNGRSLLIVAIDDMDKHHNSLQLSIEHYSDRKDKCVHFWHDGTLTVGKKGKAKKQDVLDYVQMNSALTVENEQIILGQLDMSALVYVDSEDMKDFIKNLILYALVRDEFRQTR